jgi:hypothetical protein
MIFADLPPGAPVFLDATRSSFISNLTPCSGRPALPCCSESSGKTSSATHPRTF